jgi:DNA-binding transcriptional ArsR family regulator
MLDVFYQSLADRHRRIVLSYLLSGGERSVTLGELADRVVQSDPDSASSDRKSVEVSLHHQHLPLLAEQGLIDYERDRGTVKRTARTEQITPFVAVVESLDRKPDFDYPEADARQ